MADGSLKALSDGSFAEKVVSYGSGSIAVDRGTRVQLDDGSFAHKVVLVDESGDPGGDQEFEDISCTSLTATGAISATSLALARGTITSDLKAVDASVTINNAGVAFTPYKFSVTNTASDAASKYFDVQVNGSSAFYIYNNDWVAIPGVLQATYLYTPPDGQIGWLSRSAMYSPADGVVKLVDGGGTDFGRLQFGGETASFPALKRSSTSLQARLADDSAFAPLQGMLRTDNAYAAGAIVPTGSIILYDSTGTAYKVAAVAA
jgi:hypothetical protein